MDRRKDDLITYTINGICYRKFLYRGTCHADLIAFLSKTVAFNPLPMPTPLRRHPIPLLLLFSLTFFVHFLPPPPFPFFTKAKLFSTLYDII